MKHNLKITLKTLAPLAISTGKNDGFVDNDILTDDMGFPFINQRRLKGLMKEAISETLEICGHQNVRHIVHHIFGQKGATLADGQCQIDFTDARAFNFTLHHKAALYKNMPANYIKNHFTKIIQQTAIDQEYKTAKKGSLRKIRAIKEGQKFIFTIGFDDTRLEPLIKLALLQWSFMGSSRNNGLGNVKLSIKETPLTDLEALVNDVKALQLSIIQNNLPSSSDKPSPTYTSPLKLKIHLTDKLLITGTSVGDQNTVQSKTYIDGRTIWGALATRYLNTYGEDADFKVIFRDGKVRFSPAFINNTRPLALHRQTDKKSAERHGETITLYDAFDAGSKELTLKPKSGYLTTQKIFVKPTMSAAFHFNRENNRRSGVSEGGEIFYYDALSKGQSFYTHIAGDQILLNKIASMIGDKSLECRLGRSKSIEYGHVKISIDTEMIDTVVLPEKAQNSFKFYCLSPCLIINKHGMAEPTLANVTKELIDKEFDIESINIIAGFTQYQSHSGVWRSMTSNEPCFNVGTTFEVKLKKPLTFQIIESKLADGVGLNTHQGFGQVKVIVNDVSSYKLPVDEENRYTPTAEEIQKIKASTLYTDYMAYSIDLEVSVKAMENANNSKISINNHQISRLKKEINNAADIAAFRIFITNAGYKPLAEIMNKLKWETIYPTDYEKFKTYMTAFLDAKRMKNNTKNNTNDDSK